MIQTQDLKFFSNMNKAMKSQDQIRNIAISGTFDNGQQYLYNILIKKWGVQTNTDLILTDNEQEFGQEFQSQCNIKNLFYQKKINKKEEEVEDGYLINLMKSQNNYHKQTESLARLSDGAIIIINFEFYLNNEIETIIRTFLKEQNKIVFFINKIEKAFLQQNLNGEEIYINLNLIIEKITQIIQLYESDRILNPAFGQIIFGSAKQQWGFTCLQFAQFYENKFGIEHKKLAEKLWGDHYFDTSTKQWSTVSKDSQPLKRAFVAFILDPILKLSQAIMNGQKDVVYQMIERIGIQLNEDVKKQDGKELLKSILSIWINLADAIMQSCILQIPSPRNAQNYRAASLCKLDKNDKLFESIRDCNPKGPLVIQICLMIPYKQEFISIGRVYSGTIYTGQQIKILGCQQKDGKNQDLFQVIVGQTFCFPQGEPAYLEQIPSGNIVGIKGIDQFIKGTCTITDIQHSIQMTPIQYQQDNLVRITITPVDPIHLTFVIEAIKQLMKLHPTISLQLDPCLILTGNTYHHLQFFMEELINKYLNNVEIKKSNYFVSYRETITDISNKNQIKTPNKHNMIEGIATPLSDNLLNQIESDNQSITFKESLKINSKNWFQNEKLKIMAFGPNNIGPNILVNKSNYEDYQHLSEIEVHLNTTWQWFTKEGALCDEELRGVQINILQYLSHADNIHRGAGQIIPTARRLFYGCQLQAQPRLQEPVFLVEIHSNIYVIDQVYKCLNNAKGIVIEEKSFSETSFQKIKAYVKGPNIFQFHDSISQMTQNKAYSISSFDHWSLLNSDPLEDNSEANQILQDIRVKKGLSSQIQNYL